MASLLITQGPNTGQRFVLAPECSIIGRQPDTQIYLDSLAVSRVHAQIVRQNGGFFVEDLDSSNGTFVNVVRAQRSRNKRDPGDYPYSKTIVRRALEEGVGLLSEDVSGDSKLVLSATLMSLNLRSFLCVPLLGADGRRLGVIQLDCVRMGQLFRPDDLELLTAIALHVAVVLENALLHAELLREARLRQ